MLRACTRPTLPSNLMIRVCSHFHSDRKGTMRKIEEAVRRKNKSDEDCYRPQRPPQSLSLWLPLSYFHWDNVDKNLWMQSSHIRQIHWMLQGASLTVQGAQADLLCWSSWPLSHVLCMASSPNFCCQVDNSSSFKTINNAIKCCKLSQKEQSLCKTISKALRLKDPF